MNNLRYIVKITIIKTKQTMVNYSKNRKEKIIILYYIRTCLYIVN